MPNGHAPPPGFPGGPGGPPGHFNPNMMPMRPGGPDPNLIHRNNQNMMQHNPSIQPYPPGMRPAGGPQYQMPYPGSNLQSQPSLVANPSLMPPSQGPMKYGPPPGLPMTEDGPNI